MRRRDMLALAGGSMTVAVAGCMEGDDEEETDDSDDEGEGAEAEFSVSAVAVSEGMVEAGTELEVTAEVTNSGEQSGQKDVELRQAGETVDSVELELDGGESESVAFTPDTDLEPGDYTVSIWTEDDEGSDEFTIGLPAQFEVGDVAFPDDLIGRDDPTLELVTDVTNTGDFAGTKAVELRRDGDTVDSEELELDPDETDSVVFDIDTDLDLDSYVYSVWTEDSDASDELTIVEPASFEVSNLVPETTEIGPGQLLDVAADIENTGAVTATKAVELRVDGEAIASQELTLDPEQAETAEFEEVDTAALDLGEFEHSIWTEDDEVTGSLTIAEGILEPGTLDLTVLDPEEAPLEGATVVGEEIEEETDAEGQLELELSPGTYELTISFEDLENVVDVEIEEAETTTLTVILTGVPDVTGFDAVNTSGFTAFGEDNEEEAREEGIQFPPGDVEMSGVVEDGQWESTNVEFAELDVEGLATQVEAVDELTGTFDAEEEVITVEGELRVDIEGAVFEYEIAATTEQSGALEGDFDLDAGTATLVDNEFTVEDTTGEFPDIVLGLPLEEPGQAWLELVYDFEFETE